MERNPSPQLPASSPYAPARRNPYLYHVDPGPGEGGTRSQRLRLRLLLLLLTSSRMRRTLAAATLVVTTASLLRAYNARKKGLRQLCDGDDAKAHSAKSRPVPPRCGKVSLLGVMQRRVWTIILSLFRYSIRNARLIMSSSDSQQRFWF
jgi:hypothetical protein